MDRIRYFTVALLVSAGNVAVLTAAATFQVQTRCRLIEAELALQSTGTGTGNTDVQIKLNGNALLASPGLRIASGASNKTVRKSPTAAVGEPSGVNLAPGDLVTADISAITGTNPAVNAVVYLLLAAIDD